MRFIRNIFITSIIFMLAVAGACQSSTAKQDAQKAGEQWLGVIDAGKYADSYDAAATMFKAAVTKQQWMRSVSGVRDPLGSLVSRTLATATYATELPGAPDGEYVVLKFKTSFHNKKEAVETVTMALDKDGQWRAAGYFIR